MKKKNVGRNQAEAVFDTDRRIRLGLWGLGRGLSFSSMCAQLHLDVVAGCDFNEPMRRQFLELNPQAQVTNDAEEFLSWDFDAVLLATFCPNHADDAIACLRAGKHVLSEVTAFHTLAEGVRLVEAVEKSGLTYALGENYPFIAPMMYLAQRWKEGLFGELMYAEGEYLHDVRSLAYTHIDGTPVTPGHTVHSWRSWLNFHYYCTHSLGPIMFITGTRPTRVTALPGAIALPGCPDATQAGLNGIATSLITMSNGAVVRNLMGGTTNDGHLFRLWGTRGAAEVNDRLSLRLGASGYAPKLEVTADWGELTELAAQAGHGGGDFWVLYYFARQLLFGTPAPFDVYAACDMTIPGILAYRSATQHGQPFEVPDFRDRAVRRRYRNDHGAQPRYDVKKGCFPKGADREITGPFTQVMTDLLRHVTTYRAYADWSKVIDSVKEPERVAELAEALVRDYPDFVKTMKAARCIADAYPRSDGARAIRELLALADEPVTTRRGFIAHVKRLKAAKPRRTSPPRRS